MSKNELIIKLSQGNNVAILEVGRDKRYLEPREALQLNISTLVSEGARHSFQNIGKIIIGNSTKFAKHTINFTKVEGKEKYFLHEEKEASKQKEPFIMLKQYEYKYHIPNGFNVTIQDISA